MHFLGARVPCEVRGIVEIVGLSQGPHPWPVGHKDGKEDLVVYRGLASAVRDESPDAVAARWGVPVEAVVEWKSHLDKAAEVKPPKPIMRGRRIGRPPHTRQWTPQEDEIVRTTMLGEAAEANRCHRGYDRQTPPPARRWAARPTAAWLTHPHGRQCP